MRQIWLQAFVSLKLQGKPLAARESEAIELWSQGELYISLAWHSHNCLSILDLAGAASGFVL